jgi:hypothetical protein
VIRVLGGIHFGGVLVVAERGSGRLGFAKFRQRLRVGLLHNRHTGGHAHTRDRNLTEAIDNRLAELHKALFLESNPIPVKWAVGQLDLIPPGIRLPLTPLSDALHPAVLAAMRQAGVIG